MKATKPKNQSIDRIRNLYDRAARDYERAVKAKEIDAAKKLERKMLLYDKQLAKCGESTREAFES